MSESGAIDISMMKNWVSHIRFLRKRGLIAYLAALKRRLFGTHILRTMTYIGSYPPPPRDPIPFGNFAFLFNCTPVVGLAGVQLKRKAKLPTVIGLTTKHAVCCIFR